jgi:hypothetical protein
MNGDEDLPIPGLADLETPVSPGFLQLFRRRIYRRTTAAQLAHFSFSLPFAISMEFLSIVVHLFSVMDGKRGKSK